MSSFNPAKRSYLLLKITHENYEKYCADLHVPVESYLGFNLFEGSQFYASTVEHNDYICSSDEEFDQLIFLYHLEN